MVKIASNLLRDTITIERYAGSGSFTNEYAEAEVVKAHVETTNRLAIDPLGRNARVEAIVYLRPEVAPVPVDSRITWGGVTFRVLTAGALPDEVRPEYRRLQIG